MTKEELILKGQHKVRNTPSLMFVYQQLYKEQFGKEPNCWGCSFNSDWSRFVSSQSKQLNQTMIDNPERTFVLKSPKHEIFSYRKDNRTYRSYNHRMKDWFVIDYLTYGTEEEIKERKNKFKELPKALRDVEIKETETKSKPRRTRKKGNSDSRPRK